MTVRQQIIDALEARLQAISIAGGYRTDIGARVFEWRSTDLQKKDLPAILYRDGSAPVDNGVADFLGHQLQVDIQIITQGATAPADLREMVADVLQAIGVDATWGGLARNTLLTQVDMEIEQADKILGGASIALEIHYDTNDWSI